MYNYFFFVNFSLAHNVSKRYYYYYDIEMMLLVLNEILGMCLPRAWTWKKVRKPNERNSFADKLSCFLTHFLSHAIMSENDWANGRLACYWWIHILHT